LNIFDTNCLLYHPEVLSEYKDVVVPYTVLDELDKIKADGRRSRDTRYIARRATRLIRELDIKCEDFGFEDTYADLALLLDLSRDNTVYTKDMLLYEKGKALNRDIVYFEPELDTYTGVVKRKLPTDKYDKFMEHNNIGWEEDLPQNQFVDFGRALGRYKDGQIFKISWRNSHKIAGIDELNRRQIMAYDVLFDPKIKVVVLWGVAGTGKTALAIKSAIQLAQQEEYENVLLSRPNVEVGEELGILPGGINDKQSPFIQPFRDNMKSFQMKTVPQIQPLSTVKGRDIKDTFYIIDEAQDIPPNRMKMLVERMGENSKLIITGDIRQVDKRGLTPKYNGISFVANRLKGQELFACIELDEVERSEVSKLGELLRESI
jgi:PhoH-like ATPase